MNATSDRAYLSPKGERQPPLEGAEGHIVHELRRRQGRTLSMTNSGSPVHRQRVSREYRRHRGPLLAVVVTEGPGLGHRRRPQDPVATRKLPSDLLELQPR